MARAKEFDPTVALDDAMRLFWRKGYEGTSTSDLVAELGIARASLYATFGSKRSLYLAALDRFLSGAVGPRAGDLLSSHESALTAIRGLLEAYVSVPEETPSGCFAVNATVEHGDVDPEISRRLEGNRARLETALFGALLRAQADGELAPGVEPRPAAAMLVAFINGLKVLARAGAGEQDRMDVAVDTVMLMLGSASAVPRM